MDSAMTPVVTFVGKLQQAGSSDRNFGHWAYFYQSKWAGAAQSTESLTVRPPRTIFRSFTRSQAASTSRISA